MIQIRSSHPHFLLFPGTSGIGKAAVLALAMHQPSHIYFTGRNSQAGSAVEAQAKSLTLTCPVTFIQCDLSSPRETIRRALVDHFHSARLNIFIANVGVMAIPPGLTTEGFKLQFGTNYLGHAVLLSLLRPIMMRTADMPRGAHVRLVVLSSFGHNMHPPGGIEFDRLRTADAGTKWQRYGQSKLADILLAKGMAKRYPQITSVSVHPGLVRTELGGRVEPSMWTPLLRLARWTPLFQSPAARAYNTLWAATTSKDNLENGAYYEPVGKRPGEPTSYSGVAKICSDEDLADKLWEWTEKELGGLEKL